MKPLPRRLKPSFCAGAICRLTRLSRPYPSGLSNTLPATFRRAATAAAFTRMNPIDYNCWTKMGLVKRIRKLEAELQRLSPAPPPEEARLHVDGQNKTTPTPGLASAIPSPRSLAERRKKKKNSQGKMDPSKHSTRFIALKLAYLGKNYGGFEFQASSNKSTIEEELWKALTTARLIFPDNEDIVDFGICEYTKCGRTDSGVSAFGQVIALRVRSNRPLPKRETTEADGTATVQRDEDQDQQQTTDYEQERGEAEQKEQERPFNPIADEIRYHQVLNRLLPPDIRILAWCPSPPLGFSARFSCCERQYRYFFTQPAFSPEPLSSSSPGARDAGPWLDIEAMRDAAKRFEGEHDFRNVCQVNQSKLITDWTRTVFESDIVEVRDVATALPYITAAAGLSPAEAQAAAAQGAIFPKVYYLHVRGSAFLWHQIRHMVAVLFLVGQGLEKPSIVSDLLDLAKYPTRPAYKMADEVPLVLWDCIFPDTTKEANVETPSLTTTTTTTTKQHVDSMQWIYTEGSENTAPSRISPWGPHSMVENMWGIWRDRKMDELLAGQLLQLMAEQAAEKKPSADGAVTPAREKQQQQQQQQQQQRPRASGKAASVSVRLFEGGRTGRQAGMYVPVEKRMRLATPEELNNKFARRKGYLDAADMRARRYQDREEVAMEEDE